MSDVDERGFPGTNQSDGSFDGGDTAAIIGNIMALGGKDPGPTSLKLMRSMLIRTDGLVRHPDKSKWYGQPDRFSRDQLIPILCSFAGQTPTAEVRLILHHHRKNNFLWAWNKKKNGVMDTPDKMPDITGPEIWALWCRVLGGPWWLKLLLPLLDLETLLGSITWRWFQPDTNRVCRNHMLICITGMKTYPTLTMRLAYWLNDWKDLITKHRAHCAAVGEYQTADLFEHTIK